mgnify:CR=1 FL=1
MNDPIADMLTRIRNSQLRGKSTVITPASKLRAWVLDVLADEDCTEDFKLEARREQKAARFTQHVVDLVAQGYTPLIAVEKALAADPSLSFFLGSDTMQEMLKRAGSLSAPGLEWGQVGTDTPE